MLLRRLAEVEFEPTGATDSLPGLSISWSQHYVQSLAEHTACRL